MKKIKVLCGHCQRNFDFEHPSVNKVEDLRNVTLDCGWCGNTIKVPDDEVYMIDIGEYMRRSLVRQGHLQEGDPAPQVGYIDLTSPVIEVDFQKRSRVTPAIMPPHPPALPKRKSQRPVEPLTHRPFTQLFDQEKD